MRRANPKVKRIGRGEASTIEVDYPMLPRFVMTQSESRALINALSKVTLMPPKQRPLSEPAAAAPPPQEGEPQK